MLRVETAYVSEENRFQLRRGSVRGCPSCDLLRVASPQTDPALVRAHCAGVQSAVEAVSWYNVQTIGQAPPRRCHELSVNIGIEAEDAPRTASGAIITQ